MLHRHHTLLQRGIQLCDLLLIWGAMWLGTIHWEQLPAFLTTGMTVGADSWLVGQALVMGVAWLVVSTRLDFYHSRRTDSLPTEFRALVEAWLLSMGSAALVATVFMNGLAFQPVITFVAALVGIFGLRLAVRLLLRCWRDRGWNIRRVLLVGRGRSATAIHQELTRHTHFGIQVVGSIRLPGDDETVPTGIDHLGGLMVPMLRTGTTDPRARLGPSTTTSNGSPSPPISSPRMARGTMP